VLTLQGHIQSAVSGAPLIDPDGGVVIGVVNTKLTTDSGYVGGTALLIAVALQHPRILPLIDGNPRTVPAYGKYLNLPAAQALCQSVTAQAIAQMEYAGRVDLDRRVPRRDFEEAADRLIAAKLPALALVGPAGFGKSTELAAIAQRSTVPTLLLRGASIEPKGGLKEAVAAALGTVGVAGLSDDPVGDLTRAAETAGGLVIVIDALNEMPVGPWRELREWLATSRAWATKVNARMIVSCRTDIWESVGDGLIPTELATKCVVPLARFTDEEYADARRRHAITSSFDHAILRIPLAIGLFAKLRRDARPAERVTMDALIESFVDSAAQQVALGGASSLTKSGLLDRLGIAAKKMLESDEDRLDTASFDDLFGAQLTEAFLMEGLLGRVTHGYQFVIDDIGDWLKGQNLDPENEIERFTSDERNTSWRRLGPIGYALRARERRDGTEAVLDTLLPLVESIPPDYKATQLIAETLAKVADATPYKPVLEKLSIPRGADGYSEFESLVQVSFWNDVPLRVSDHLDLLQNLVTYENSYSWRLSDWPKEILASASADYAALAFKVVEASPEEGVRALLPWIHDKRELEDGSACVAYVAMGIMFRLRDLAPGAVWDVIAAAGTSAAKLVIELANNDPRWLEEHLTTTGNAQLDDSMFVRAVRHMMERRSISPAAAAAVLDSLTKRFERGLDPRINGPAIALRAHLSKQEEHVLALVDGYRGRVLDLYARDLSALLEDNPDLITKALLGFLSEPEADTDDSEPEADTDDARAKFKVEDVLTEIKNISDPTFLKAADEAVLRYFERVGAEHSQVYYYVEHRLYESATASDALLKLTRAVISAPGQRDILAQALTNSEPLKNDPATREALLDELIEQGDSDVLASVLKTATRGSSQPYDLALVTRILSRLDPDRADSTLLSSARQADFAAQLYGWLTEGAIQPPGFRLVSFKDHIAGGEPMKSAAMTVFKEQLRRGSE
jgi:hypothetical protein